MVKYIMRIVYKKLIFTLHNIILMKTKSYLQNNIKYLCINYICSTYIYTVYLTRFFIHFQIIWYGKPHGCAWRLLSTSNGLNYCEYIYYFTIIIAMYTWVESVRINRGPRGVSRATTVGIFIYLYDYKYILAQLHL